MRPVRRQRYHHGDLRESLIRATIEIIEESGVRRFSLTEATRRLGVAPSAPYAHFPDREALLSEVAVRAYTSFNADYLPRVTRWKDPSDRVVAVAREYVRFATGHRPLFETIYEVGLAPRVSPAVAQAARPLREVLRQSIQALPEARRPVSDRLAGAIEAVAHGYSMLYHYGEYGRDRSSRDRAADAAARTTRALIESRDRLARDRGGARSLSRP
jgi:AcrR family transcriptional regulator